LKADIVEESVTKDGNAFQMRAPATGRRLSFYALTEPPVRPKMLTAAAVLCRCQPHDVARLIGTPEHNVQATEDEHGKLELYPI